MTEDKKPKDIADGELLQAQGGVKIEMIDATIASLRTESNAIEFQDGDDLFLRKRPGRSK